MTGFASSMAFLVVAVVLSPISTAFSRARSSRLLARLRALERRRCIDDGLRRARERNGRLAVLLVELEGRQVDRDLLLGNAEEAAGAEHDAHDLVLVVDDEILDVADDLAVLSGDLGADQVVLGEILVGGLSRNKERLPSVASADTERPGSARSAAAKITEVCFI